MSKENSTLICPFCQQSDKLIKHGRRNEIQRYKCKRCNRVFPEKRLRVKYSANEETLLALLVSLMNAEKGALAKVAFKNVKDIISKTERYHLIEKQAKNDALIFCCNPRILICDNSGGNIIIYRIPEKRDNREIKIIDEGMNFNKATELDSDKQDENFLDVYSNLY